MRGWLLLDVATSVPLDRMLCLADSHQSSGLVGFVKMLRWFKARGPPPSFYPSYAHPPAPYPFPVSRRGSSQPPLLSNPPPSPPHPNPTAWSLSLPLRSFSRHFAQSLSQLFRLELFTLPPTPTTHSHLFNRPPLNRRRHHRWRRRGQVIRFLRVARMLRRLRDTVWEMATNAFVFIQARTHTRPLVRRLGPL